ncbi:MAG: hypothetical protein AB8C84_01775 [Oligoflexales bacterium]
MKKLVFLSLLCCSFQPSSGEDLGAVFYDQGKYSEAIDWYKNEVLNHPSSAFLYYNLGNAAARNGEKNIAIASYLKSLSLQYHYKNLHDNLKIVLGHQYDGFFEAYKKSWGFFFFLTIFTFKRWVQIAVVCSLIGGCFALFYRFKSMIFFLLLSLISFTFSMVFHHQNPNWSVLGGHEQVALYSGPGTFNAVVSHTDSMIPVQNLQEFNGWVQIRIWGTQNIEGWIAAESLNRF